MPTDSFQTFKLLSTPRGITAFAALTLVTAGGALAGPAAANGPIGSEKRFSSVGVTGLTTIDDPRPAVAHDPVNGRYIVVWADQIVSGATEIYGRLLTADGDPAGPAFQISEMGDSETDAYTAFSPAVAFDPVGREFIVVWSGDDDTEWPVGEETKALADGEFEIFGQRLQLDGKSIGADDFRISFTGPGASETGDGAYDAFRPAVAVNGSDGTVAVVWRGEEDVDDNFEIQGRILDQDRLAVGEERPLSVQGPPANKEYAAGDPDIVWNPVSREYMVVWDGDDNVDGVTDGAYEVWTQRTDESLAEIGADDQRISRTPFSRDAVRPSVAVNGLTGTYLVAWHSDADTIGREEVRVKLLDRFGTPSSTETFGTIVSAMPPLGGGRPLPLATEPDVAFRRDRNEFLVAWTGDRLMRSNSSGEVSEREKEVYARRVDASGMPVGTQAQVSTVGDDGDFSRDAQEGVSIAAEQTAQSGEGRVQLAWAADDPSPGAGTEDGELEIFGRQWGPSSGPGPVGPGPVGPVPGGGGGSPQPEIATPGSQLTGVPLPGGGPQVESARPPAVETGGPEVRDQKSVRVGGFVTPNGGATRYRVEYGMRGQLDQSTAYAALPQRSGRQAVSVEVPGLKPGRQYVYRLVAENEAGRAEGLRLTVRTARPSEFQASVTATTRCKVNSRRVAVGCSFLRLIVRAQLRNPNTNKPAKIDADDALLLRIICRRGCGLDRSVSLEEGAQVIPTVGGPASRFQSVFTAPKGPGPQLARVKIRRRGSQFQTTLTQVFTNGRGRPFLFTPGSEIHVLATGDGIRPSLVRIRFKQGSTTREVCRALGTRPIGCRLQ